MHTQELCMSISIQAHYIYLQLIALFFLAIRTKVVLFFTLLSEAEREREHITKNIEERGITGKVQKGNQLCRGGFYQMELLVKRSASPLKCLKNSIIIALIMAWTWGVLASDRLTRSNYGELRLLQEGQGAAPEGAVRVIGVDLLGLTGFSSIQAAIDSVPDDNSTPTTIRIAAGIYEERVVVPNTKLFITLEGAGMSLTYVQWHLKASDLGANGDELTSYNSASVTIFASNFIAKDITFKNTLPAPPPGIDGRQAAAFRISGDMAAFYRCGFIGAQDTLCDDQGRHYYEDCFIQGSIDFVFGDARSFYNGCELNSIAQSYGSVAAQDRQSLADNTGFVFVNCKITGSGPIYLGRAMGPFSLIIFAYSDFNNIIDPRGWDDWDHDTTKDRTVYYGQYKCSGAGANESQRVQWSHELSDEEVAPYLTTSFIDGNLWLPQ